MRKISSVLLTACFAVAVAFCAGGCSIFCSSTEPILVNTVQQGAVIVVNGQRVAPNSPINVRRNKSLMIQVMKEGYYPYVNNVGYSLSTTGTLDAVGLFLFLFPGIGLVTPGAWSLDQTTFYVELTPM